LDRIGLKNNVVRVLDKGCLPDILPLTQAAEESGAAYLVGNGRILEEHQLRIRSQDGHTWLESYEIGEIWISGPAVSKGYLNHPEETKHTFHPLPGTNEIYLRTGDLGFLDEHSDLYVTGRIKDLIIVRGLNHYPQDIERTACSSDPALHTDGAAAFSIMQDGVEKLVLIQELDRSSIRSANYDQLASKIRQAIVKEHEIMVETIVFVPTRHIPRTTSGKVRRKQAKSTYIDNAWKKVLNISNLHSVKNAVAIEVLPGLKDSSYVELLAKVKHLLHHGVNGHLIDERRALPPTLFVEFAKLGMWGLLVPKALGGLQCNVSQAMHFIETVASRDASIGFILNLHNLVGIRPILHYAKAQLRNEIIPKMARGESLAAFALTEAEAGSNPYSMISTARLDSDGNWELNGEKTWVSSAAWSGYITVFMQGIDASGHYLGVTAFVVKQGTEGLVIDKETLTLGIRGSVHNTIRFNQVKLSDQYLLGRPGDGVEIIKDALKLGRVGTVSFGIGLMRTALAQMKTFAANRNISSGTLIDMPVILERINRAMITLDVAINCQTRLLAWMDRGEPIPGLLISACKVMVTEEMWKTVDHLMQLTGTRGYFEPNGIARLFRDSRALRIMQGPTESLIMDIGSRTDDEYRDLTEYLRRSTADNDLWEDIHRIKERVDIKIHSRDRLEEKERTKYHAFRFGEALVWRLILALTNNAATTDAKDLIRGKMALLMERLDVAYATNTSRSNFESEYHRINGEHEIHSLHQQDTVLRVDNSAWHQRETSPHPDPALVQETKDTVTQAPRREGIVRSVEAWISLWLKNQYRNAGIVFADSGNSRIATTSFAEFGMDSSLSVQFVNDLNKEYKLKLAPSILWSYSTPKQLAEYLYHHKLQEQGRDCPFNQSPAPADEPQDEMLEEMIRKELS
jgi:alkylation response protein AidB-like acyl-CoA dehydrogenase/acyl carrier protein